MKTRIITGFVLAVTLGALVYFGEGELAFLFNGLCLLLAGVASFEFMLMLRHGKTRRWHDYLSILNTLILTLVVILSMHSFGFFIYMFITITVMLLFYALLYVAVKSFTKEDFAQHFLTILYCSLGFIAFAYLRLQALELIIYLFLVAMLTDVFAYFIGIKFGKHRLAEHISPKKSVEGAIAGLLIGGGLASLFAYYFELLELAYPWILVMSLGASVIAQIGDLIASKFKREAGIKDYSNIFPGHGGVLDRFDSSLFVAIFLMVIVIIL